MIGKMLNTPPHISSILSKRRAALSAAYSQQYREELQRRVIFEWKWTVEWWRQQNGTHAL